MALICFACAPAIGACRHARPEAAPAADVRCADFTSLKTGAGPWTHDDLFSAVARVLPGGFGGITTTYMFLKEPSLADSARRVARVLATCTDDGYPTRLWSLAQTVEVRRGDYDWLELERWYAVAMKNVPSDGLRSAGISEGSNRLEFGFADTAALNAFRARAIALGVPAGMLRLGIRPPISWRPQGAE